MLQVYEDAVVVVADIVDFTKKCQWTADPLSIVKLLNETFAK